MLRKLSTIPIVLTITQQDANTCYTTGQPYYQIPCCIVDARDETILQYIDIIYCNIYYCNTIQYGLKEILIYCTLKYIVIYCNILQCLLS